MDKQKKIMLQVVIPVAIIFLSILFFLIFKYVFQESGSKKQNSEINIEFPDVKRNIEPNKIKAYEVQESYERQSRNENSDLSLEYNIPTKTDTIIPKEKEVKRSEITQSKKTSRQKPTNLRKRLEIQAEMAENEYQEFTKTSDITSTPTTPEQKPIVTIPSDVTFNSMSIKKQDSQLQQKEIYGFIHNEQTVINRSLVKLRTAEPLIVRNYIIPANTLLDGMCSFANDRVLINIKSVPWQNRAIACNINVYDLNGFEGVSVYDHPETEAHKKSGAATSRRMGSLLGTAVKSVTGTTLAGELSGTLAEGVIKGASNGTSNKINLNKAVLTNNYRIILKIK